MGFGFDAESGSVVNISGGDVGRFFIANDGSEVNITGGTVGGVFRANSGSEVNISGGTFGVAFRNETNSNVNFFGGEFQLNGDPFTGATISLAEDDVFTGTLADGSSFIFAPTVTEVAPIDTAIPGDTFSGASLSAVPLPVLNTTPVVIDSPVTDGPVGLRSGQTLTVVEGGSLPDNFAVVDATLSVQGGTLARVETAGSEVNIDGGDVTWIQAYSGSEVGISGGDVGRVVAVAGSEVNINGGNIERVLAFPGSVVNISGGNVARNPEPVIAVFIAEPGSQVNIRGTEFWLNGQPLDALVADEVLTITEPIRSLSGVLADGSSFGFFTNSRAVPFSSDATVTLTSGPAALLGDFDADGDVDLDDLDGYHQNISAVATGDLADLDLDGDGIVGANDFQTHYQQLVMTSNGQVGTVQGDANLDGVVDVLGDGFIFFGNLNDSVSSWSRADFDGNGEVDVLGDAFALIANLGFTNAP